jgi:IS30 family transposase
MKKYKQLTAADRKAIEVLLNHNHTRKEISKELGVHHSTISREISKRGTPNGYFAKIAQIDYESRRSRTGRKKKISHSETKGYIESKLRRGWSPEQISGRMKYEGRGDRVCHETIYQWIYDSKYGKEDKLFQYLRYASKKRGKWNGRSKHR